MYFTEASLQFPWTKNLFSSKPSKLHLWYPVLAVAEISLAKCTNPCGKKRLRFFAQNQTHQKIMPDIVAEREMVTQIYIKQWKKYVQHHLPKSVPKHPCWCRWNQHGAFAICHRMSASVRHLPKGPPCMRAATSDVRLQWSTTIRV